MKILSINFGHDASLALLDDGKLTAFVELERVTRLKHCLGIKSSDIEEFLRGCGVAISQIDLAAVSATQLWSVYHTPDIKVELGYTALHQKYIPHSTTWNRENFGPTPLHPPGLLYGSHLPTRGIDGASVLWQRGRFDFPLYHGSPPTGGELDALVEQHAVLIDSALHDDGLYRKLLSDHIVPCVLTCKGAVIPGFHVQHHLAHGAYGHYYGASPDSLVVSHDGGLPNLPFNSGGVYAGLGKKIIPLLSHKLALGYLYDRAGMAAGFTESEGPGKLMGLAPYGFASEAADGLLTELLEFCREKKPYERAELDLFLKKVEQVAQRDRRIRTTDCKPFVFNFPDRDFSIALAANMQKLVADAFTLAVAPYLNKVMERVSRVKSVGLVGGFTLNCPANTQLQAALGAKCLNPLPGAIDSGLAIGAAVAVASWLGQEVAQEVDATGSVAAFPARAALSLASGVAVDERFAAVDVAAPLHEFLAAQLAQGKIICLHRGVSEIGPRALGHRSILAKASSIQLRDHLNARKGREGWRPLAPMVRKEDFAEYFSGQAENCRFMLFTYPVTSDRIPGVTHVDGTARVQTIEEGDDLLNGVLLALRQHGEPAVIINTSFNTAGEPIVETAQQAFNSFYKLGFDYLVLERSTYCRK